MRNHISELLAKFRDLHRRRPISVSQTRTTNEAPKEDPRPESDQGSKNGDASQVKLKKLTAMERLGGLLSFRIHESAIKFPSSMAHGIGGKAEVVRATLTTGDGTEDEDIAVKKLRYHDGIDKKGFCNEFVHEVELMAGFSHKNIIRLIGFVEDLENGKAWIVLSWAPNGNLREFLATAEWEIPERLSLIKDTFAGLHYLHTHQPPICHGDLKSLNILVSSSCRAMLTDFGSARALSDTVVVRDHDRGATRLSTTDASSSYPEVTVVATGKQLTLTGPEWSLRWVAPEVAMGGQQTLASDIWSAGWVCWEIMTNQVPYSELDAEGVITLKVIQGEVPVAREDGQLSQIIRLCSLMADCWIFDPEGRPTIVRCNSEVKRMPSVVPSKGRPSGSKASSPKLLIKMGRIHYAQDSYESAISLFQQALSIAMSASNEAVGAEALYNLGDVYRIQRKFREAQESYAHALDIYTRIGDVVGQATALERLARIYREESKLSEAKETLALAQEKFRSTSDRTGEANTLHVLGRVYYRELNYAKAEEFHSQAKNIYTNIGDARGLANSLHRLGELHNAQSKFAEAEEFYTEAQDIYIRLGDYRCQGRTLRGLGEACISQMKYVEAEGFYTQARDVYTQIGLVSRQADMLLRLGDLGHHQGRNAEAAAFYTDAKDLFAQIGHTEYEERVSRRLARLSMEGVRPPTLPS